MKPWASCMTAMTAPWERPSALPSRVNTISGDAALCALSGPQGEASASTATQATSQNRP
jgi:hypothetical protein